MNEQKLPRQQQEYPGSAEAMDPQPHDQMAGYEGRDLLRGRRALVTGGDSGIGRAVAVAFAKEGADVAVAYLSEDDDARRTAKLVEEAGRRCVLIRGDLSAEEACSAAFAGGPVALAYAHFDTPTRQDAHAEYLAAIEPYRQGSGYAIPGEFVMTSGRKL